MSGCAEAVKAYRCSGNASITGNTCVTNARISRCSAVNATASDDDDDNDDDDEEEDEEEESSSRAMACKT